MEDRRLLLPGEPGFAEILAYTPPPNWREVAARDGTSYAYVAEPGSALLRAVGMAELEEYLEGGEYDDRLAELDDWEEDWDDGVD